MKALRRLLKKNLRSQSRLVFLCLVPLAVLIFGSSAPASATDMGVSIEPGAPEPVAAGDDFVYVVKASNLGPVDSTGATVTILLPEQAHYLADDASCTESAGTLTCAVGPTQPLDIRTIRVMVRFQSDAALPTGAAALPVTASIAGLEVDPNSGNNSATYSTLITERAELHLTLIVPDQEVRAGEVFQYSIHLDNYGPSVARNVVIRDTLFAGVANSIDTLTILSCAFSVSQGGGSITQFTCTTGDLIGTQFGSDVGIFRTNALWPEVDPDSDFIGPGRLRASFRLSAKMGLNPYNRVTGMSETPDPDTANNMADSYIQVVASSDLHTSSAITAEVQTDGLPGAAVDTDALPPIPDPACCSDGGTTVTAGRRIQWQTTVTNGGPSAANNSWIEVLLPAGTSLIENTLTVAPSAGLVPGNCFTEPAEELRSSVFCQYQVLEANKAAALRFQVLVDPALLPWTHLSIDSRAGADEVDPNLSSNIDSVQLVSSAWADLATHFADIPPGQTWEPLDLNSFEVRVENNGPSLAVDSALLLELPEEFEFEGATAMYAGPVVSTRDPAAIEDLGPLACQPLSATELVCFLGDLPVTTHPVLGAVPLRVFVSGRVQSGTPPTTTLTATATPTSSTPDPYGLNNESSETAGETVDIFEDGFESGDTLQWSFTAL